MMRGDLADLSACSFFRAAEANQRADFIKRESQLARTSYERKRTKMRVIVNSPACRRAWRCRQYLNSLVITHGLDVRPALAGQLADGKILASRIRELSRPVHGP